VTKKIDELANTVTLDISNTDIIQDVMDYSALKKSAFRKAK
jgi:hypothetical protein